MCLLPVADERMHEQRIDSCCLGTGCRCLDGVLLIRLYNAHETDDMSVIDLVDSDGLCAVLADNSGYLENVVIVHEINSAVILDVDYLGFVTRVSSEYISSSSSSISMQTRARHFSSSF